MWIIGANLALFALGRRHNFPCAWLLGDRGSLQTGQVIPFFSWSEALSESVYTRCSTAIATPGAPETDFAAEGHLRFQSEMVR